MPINDKDISLIKEILTITRINAKQVQVNVYYELMNNAAAKEVLVGFEAVSPSGDVDGTPVKGEHPYMYNFTVQMNVVLLPYKVAIVDDSLYYKNGKFIDDKKSYQKADFETNAPDFFYVYHFKANFIKGKNIIRHSYVLDISSGVDYLTNLQYVLTTAKRWANKKIDDFTLQIDLGRFSDLKISNSFFTSDREWTIVGTGKSLPVSKMEHEEGKWSQFYIQQGSIFFRKNNFVPNGNIHILSLRNYQEVEVKTNPLNFALPFSDKNSVNIDSKVDKIILKILRNLPYARRGYVFQSADLKGFYEKQEWYMPNPNFKIEGVLFTKEEEEFLKGLDK